jgi:hypothetical protein
MGGAQCSPAESVRAALEGLVRLEAASSGREPGPTFVACFANGQQAAGTRRVHQLEYARAYLTRPIASLTAAASLRAGLGAPFLIAGALKSAYDLGLYLTFRNVAVEGERMRKLTIAG